MRSTPWQTLILPSVLDRLFDDQPKETTEPHGALHFDLRQYKRAVARDLEALLNTRCVDTEGQIEDYPQASQSVLSFGIVDLSSLSLLNPDDRLLLQDKIRIAIERHEPRLAEAAVSLEEPRELERMLRFRVDAVLKVHPDKPPVIFDATLQLSSSTYQVKGL
jgi:type VI secretion system protein ImpF